MRDKKILWVDTETTGTDPGKNGIIQLAGVLEINGNEISTFDYKIQPFPEDVIEDSALAVNGFTREELNGFMPPHDARVAFVKMLSTHVDRYNKRDKFFFAGYNGIFDLNFIHAFFKKCGDPYFGSYVWWPSVDVSVMAGHALMGVRHELPNFKLETVAAHFGIQPQGEAHDAMTDIRMTKAIYDRLLRRQGSAAVESLSMAVGE